MKFSATREQLLKPLQQVTAALGKNPLMPILGNVLLQVNENKQLILTGTDLEVEIILHLSLEDECEIGEITVSGKKLLDICRTLPEDAKLIFYEEKSHLILKAKRSRFSLATLPASDYPNLTKWNDFVEFEIQQLMLKQLIDSTQFSMANQDVRYYLNGLLFEINQNQLSSVATDGHRLAICTLNVEKNLPANSIIVPRKAILELSRLLSDQENSVKLQFNQNNLRIQIDDLIFTTKLIDGKFPDHRRVLPINSDKILIASRELLRQSFSRAAILSNEKFRGIRLNLENNQMKITANNREQEEAEEILEVDYTHDPLEIAFNVTYMIDVLNVLKSEMIKFYFTNSASSILIENSESNEARYIIMPMRL